MHSLVRLVCRAPGFIESFSTNSDWGSWLLAHTDCYRCTESHACEDLNVNFEIVFRLCAAQCYSSGLEPVAGRRSWNANARLSSFSSASRLTLSAPTNDDDGDGDARVNCACNRHVAPSLANPATVAILYSLFINKSRANNSGGTCLTEDVKTKQWNLLYVLIWDE